MKFLARDLAIFGAGPNAGFVCRNRRGIRLAIELVFNQKGRWDWSDGLTGNGPILLARKTGSESILVVPSGTNSKIRAEMYMPGYTALSIVLFLLFRFTLSSEVEDIDLRRCVTQYSNETFRKCHQYLTGGRNKDYERCAQELEQDLQGCVALNETTQGSVGHFFASSMMYALDQKANVDLEGLGPTWKLLKDALKGLGLGSNDKDREALAVAVTTKGNDAIMALFDLDSKLYQKDILDNIPDGVRNVFGTNC
jgi:hypothetical protein